MEGLVAVAHLLHDQRLRVVHLRRPPLELAPRQVGVAQRVALAEVREAVGHRAGAVLVEAPAALEVRFADALLGLERLEVRRRAARCGFWGERFERDVALAELDPPDG